MIKLSNRLTVLVSLLAIISLLTGCSGGPKAAEEILPGNLKADSDKLNIIVTCNSSLDNFAAAVEERFPGVRLIQECYTGQYRISEHIARIANNDIGDIIMVKAGHVTKADLSGHLLDLSTQPFPADFSENVLQADEDGHILLIPGPLSFNGNMYNKTLFKEKGWRVPENNGEFMALCQEIDASGIRGFQNSFFDSASQSYRIYQYSVLSALDTLTQVDGQIWHNKLMAGEEVSLEPMGTAFLDLRQKMDHGIVREEDLDAPFDTVMDAMLNREIAISSGEIDHIQALNSSGTDEFGFMPHFSMTDGQGWLLNLGYYFGANKELLQPGNEQKLKAAMDIMGFIASAEGQKLLVEDGLGMMPAVIGAEIPDYPLLEEIRTQIGSGRYIMRPGYDMFTSVLETEIAAFIRGETDSSSILDKCRLVLEQGAPPQQALGEASEDFTVLETGCIKADALRAATGTDIALIGMSEANGYDPVGGTRSKLYQGAVTEDDINRIAQIRMDTPLMSMCKTVTGEELLSMLEYGAASEAEQLAGKVGWFHPFAVSGLKLTYHLYEEEGKRVTHVTLEDGSRVKPDSLYTVSTIMGAVPDEGSTWTDSGITMTEALKDYIIAERKAVPDHKRISFILK